MKEQKDKKDISSDDDIREFVHCFYGKVEEDDRLGYIFNDHAQVDWDTHLPKMVDFWSNLLFRTRRYNGRPMKKHMPLPVKRSDFERWLNIFEETIDELYKGEVAEYAKEMAQKIAVSFALRMEGTGKFEDENKTGEP
ncbi:group III truncated hemoglobin [Aliifodinibius sp. S!AR15-10]|uniref:group III truncated hemoglobin n=1 Tax=Aliifodinibius sp. S!AR15-10 TaxID=2950437 RepID=UPI00285AF92E|nr:group III truncated hemoglobin [Aliifodinibius sp. S!AR15-10]MDR8393170.1 group III truncated hemoglobin [Aliifodinibius sp. S!AR15-10]